MLCSSSVASTGAPRSVFRLCSVGSTTQRLKHVCCSNPATVQRPSAILTSQPEDFAGSNVLEQPRQPATQQLQLATQLEQDLGDVDKERLLTLQLLNEHTAHLAGLGCSIVPAAVVPAGANAADWKQQVVDMYASHKQLSPSEAQEQIDAVLAKPQETPCFIACCQDPSVPGCKIVCGLVVGRITYSNTSSAGINLIDECAGGHQAAASSRQKQLQIDAFCVQGLNHPSVLKYASGADRCPGCTRADCCTCSSGIIGRTLLLWLLGEAGSFDDTDASIAQSARDFNQELLCLFSQLGFEPWHIPRGSPATGTPSYRSIKQGKALPHVSTVQSMRFTLQGHSGMDTAAGPSLFPAAHFQPSVARVCSATPPGVGRQSIVGAPDVTAAAMQPSGTRYVRATCGDSAPGVLQSALGPARVGGSKTSVAANAHRSAVRGYAAFSKQTNVDDGNGRDETMASATLPQGSVAVELGPVVAMYRKAGLLTQLKNSSDSKQSLSSELPVDGTDGARVSSNVVTWKT